MNCPNCKLWFPITESKCRRCGSELLKEVVNQDHQPQRCIVCDITVMRGDYGLTCAACKAEMRLMRKRKGGQA